MDTTQPLNLIHNVHLPGGRDKLLKLAEVDSGATGAATSGGVKARKSKSSSRGFFNGFAASLSPKGGKAEPTSSPLIVPSLDLSFSENIEHLVRKDSGKGSSISSKASSCDHSESDTVTAVSTVNEHLNLDLAGLRLSGRHVSEPRSRIPQAVVDRRARKASLKETRSNNPTPTTTAINFSINDKNVERDATNLTRQSTRSPFQSNIPIYKSSSTTSKSFDDDTIGGLPTLTPTSRSFKTSSSFIRSPSLPTSSVFDDSIEKVLRGATASMKTGQVNIRPSLIGEREAFNDRRQAMAERMAEQRRSFLKTSTFEPTTDAFLRKVTPIEQRISEAFQRRAVDFDRFFGPHNHPFTMFDEEGAFPNTPRRIIDRNSPTAAGTSKPFILFSTPDQRQYESVMLKEAQKETMNEMKISAKQDGTSDGMTKSASFDSIEWIPKLQPSSKLSAAGQTEKVSGNQLAGLSHLQEKTKKEEDDEIGQGIMNRFRKSYSHYFTRQATCPNLKVDRKRSDSSTPTIATPVVKVNGTTEDKKEKEIEQNMIVSSPLKRKNLATSPSNGHMDTVGLPVGKFERHRSASSRFEPLGQRKSYRRQSRKSYRLKRSHSQPMDEEAIAKSITSNTTPTSPDILDYDDEEEEEDEEFDERNERIEDVIYAEAIWDYFSNDPEELTFHAGELIDVSDTSNKEWWWGAIKETKGSEETTRYGWIPASYVRLRVNQEETIEEALESPETFKTATDLQSSPEKRMSMSRISAEQVRANVVLEIINTERVFVKNLVDVIDGYLKPSRDRVDMFDEIRIQMIFCNIEELHRFQCNFLQELEAAIDWKSLAASQVGNVFLKNEKGFAVYGEFCKNHPLAISELQDLYSEHRYVVFFEGCRLLQNMIDISLDGFLLTPIQKICKYPLQLGELLKYTRAEHADHQPLVAANAAMQRVAQMVNERKRRFEALEQLISLQEVFEGWEGDELLDSGSSLLLRSGELARLTSASSWSAKEVSLFLFDRLLVMAKKRENGLLRKVDTYCFKSRLETNDIEQLAAVDELAKDPTFNFAVKNGFKFYCRSRAKWYLFQAKSLKERDDWLRAFEERAIRVAEDEAQGFLVTDKDRKGARMAHENRQKPKKPRVRRQRTGAKTKKPDTVVAEMSLPAPLGEGGQLAFNRAGSLPSYIMQERLMQQQQCGGLRPGSTLNKKSRSNWFYLSGRSKKRGLKRNNLK